MKVFFSEPVRGVDATRFTLFDARGAPVPAWVDQIGTGTFGLFPDRITLEPGATYTARLGAGVCDTAGNCTPKEFAWTFTVATEPDQATGDTSIPFAFVNNGSATQSNAPTSTTKRTPPFTKERPHGRTRGHHVTLR